MEAELREGMRAWRQLHPKATLDEIEAELNRQMAALRVAVLAETIATSKAVKAEEEVVCPVCGVPGRQAHEGVHTGRDGTASKILNHTRSQLGA